MHEKKKKKKNNIKNPDAPDGSKLHHNMCEVAHAEAARLKGGDLFLWHVWLKNVTVMALENPCAAHLLNIHAVARLSNVYVKLQSNFSSS